MLTAPHFERIVAMWKYAEQLPCMVLLGDFWQLPVVDATAKSCEESAAWLSTVKVIPFLEQVRCKDPNLQKKLNILRTAQPSMNSSRKSYGAIEPGKRMSQRPTTSCSSSVNMTTLPLSPALAGHAAWQTIWPWKLSSRIGRRSQSATSCWTMKATSTTTMVRESSRQDGSKVLLQTSTRASVFFSQKTWTSNQIL